MKWTLWNSGTNLRSRTWNFKLKSRWIIKTTLLILYRKKCKLWKTSIKWPLLKLRPRINSSKNIWSAELIKMTLKGLFWVFCKNILKDFNPHKVTDLYTIIYNVKSSLWNRKYERIFIMLYILFCSFALSAVLFGLIIIFWWILKFRNEQRSWVTHPPRLWNKKDQRKWSLWTCLESYWESHRQRKGT